MNVGKAIKIRRIELGMSATMLCRLAECSISYISCIEKNSRDPNLKIVLAIAEALDLAPSELFARAEKLY